MSLVTPTQPQSYSFKEYQSKFISHLHPIDDLPTFRTWLSNLRKQYHDASHICWGYRINTDIQLEENYSDAGEPSGTAGLPILNAMKQKNLVNNGLAVIRYFGGTKLGKRGLIDAYGKSAREVIEITPSRPWEKLAQYTITCPLIYYGELSRSIVNINGRIVEDKSSDKLNWVVEVKPGRLNDLIQLVRSVTKGEGNLEEYKKGADAAKPRRK
tara:strand:- start:2778 stop:3416 length:639 start_codon:yes stop_codon:yes gene_type:complete